MVMVGKCCLCLSLSNGGIILGSIGAFTSLVLVILFGGLTLHYDNGVQQLYEKGQTDADFHKLASFFETYKSILMAIALTYITLQVINFVASLSLVCGTIHKRPKLIIVWLVSQAFIIAFWIFSWVLTTDITMLLYAVLSLYFLLCIFSLYQEVNLELYQQSLHYSIQAV